jgi:hypothetical protein
MIAGIVAEGGTDIIILREILYSLCPDLTLVHPISPKETFGPTIDESTDEEEKKRYRDGGFGQVMKWCKNKGPGIVDYMKYYRFNGNPLTFLVIHLDADIASKIGIDEKCNPEVINPAEKVTAAMCKEVQSWFGCPLPENIIITFPAQRTETWMRVGLIRGANPSIECDTNVDNILIKRGFLERGDDGKTAKDTSIYQKRAPEIAANFHKITTTCPEAKRFCGKIRNYCPENN